MDLNKSIEQSARKVFKVFFNSRLYTTKVIPHEGEVLGIDLMMHCGGDKRFSIYMDRKTLAKVREKLGQSAPDDGSADYDIMGEMANIIVGNAVDAADSQVNICPPERSAGFSDRGIARAIHFGSKIGGVSISLVDIH
jgi:hypothetical protein